MEHSMTHHTTVRGMEHSVTHHTTVKGMEHSVTHRGDCGIGLPSGSRYNAAVSARFPTGSGEGAEGDEEEPAPGGERLSSTSLSDKLGGLVADAPSPNKRLRS